jgi:ribonuclease BN (tRNA processing enzyme)
MIHLRDHHLTPQQVGELAQAAEVKALAVTHISAPAVDEAREREYLAEIARKFPGDAAIAEDLETF